MLNRQVHVHPGDGQRRWDREKGGLCSIDEFTYVPEMGEGDGIMRREVREEVSIYGKPGEGHIPECAEL